MTANVRTATYQRAYADALRAAAAHVEREPTKIQTRKEIAAEILELKPGTPKLPKDIK